VKVASDLAVRPVGGDEGGEGDGGGVGEEFGDLCFFWVLLITRSGGKGGHFREGHTSAMRRMFSLRSFSEKPRSLFRPKRTLSPSRR
jgi:hypothetical protein